MWDIVINLSARTLIADMARNKELTQQRNTKIVEMYDTLCNIKDGRAYKYTQDWILQEIERKFFLTPNTIMKIVKQSA